jgi:hypothetical protein
MTTDVANGFTYVHASDPDLEQGRRALARIHKIEQLNFCAKL